jgi:protein SCO1/2
MRCSLRRDHSLAGLPALALAAVLIVSCGGDKSGIGAVSVPGSAPQATTQANQAAQPAAAQPRTTPEGAKVYQLKGKIVAVKADQNSLAIDGEDIPGFMSAMTMDYSVKSKDSIAGLKAGDAITADIVVPQGGQAYLENIKKQ